MGNSISEGGVLYAGVTNGSEIFQHFYPQLIELLAVDDVVLLSTLFAANLPEDHLKSGDINKQAHFQKSVINESVTLTELYQLLIVTTLQKQVKEDDKPTHPVDSEVEKIFCDTLKGIPNQVMGTVFCLSRLAYHSFFDWYSKKGKYNKIPKVVFTIEDLVRCGLKVTDCFYGLLKAASTEQLPTDNVAFSFTHFTIQDFMCALYMTTLSQEEQEQLLKEDYHFYSNVAVFWSGLVSSKATQFVCYCLHDDERSIMAAECLYESKQTSLMLPIEVDRLTCDYNILSPYECLAISTVLSHHRVDDLSMMGCEVGDEGMKMLTHHLDENSSVHPLLRLNLIDNNFTITGARLLLKVMKNSRFTLTSLYVSGNPIGDDGILLLIEGLDGNKVLDTLEVSDCEITIKGVSCIAEFLKTNNQPLGFLSLSNNNFGDDGVVMIVDALKSNSKINELSMDNCGMTVKGATYIAELVRTKLTLTVFAISENYISDDGVTAIAEYLGQSNILKLFLDECGMTFNGAKVLAKSLLTNKTLSVVSLSDNPITVEGARAIFESLVGNGTLCPNVLIDSHLHEDDHESQLMNKLLDSRRRRQYLKRCRKFDDDDSCMPPQVKKCED